MQRIVSSTRVLAALLWGLSMGACSSGGGSGGDASGTGGASGGTTGTGGGVPGSGGSPGPVQSGCTATDMSGIAHPFGGHGFAYAAGSIRPTGDRAALDDAASAFYQKWKAIYVDAKGCSEGTHIVFHHFLHGREVTVSEAMGYGMVILVMMAGCDAEAHAVFDSMHAFIVAHTNANGLLSWKQVAGSPGGPCGDDATDSATDGDLDVAFSYVAADRQWGSGGSVNYLAEAEKWMAAIQAHETSPAHVTRLGDLAEEDTTRPSDWMFDHFRAFAKLDAIWSQTLDETYKVADHIQTKYSPKTGLIPDYVLNPGSADPSPAAPGTEVQESSFTDSEVAYNSCRVPWHLGTDFLVSGDARAKKASDAINNWIKVATAGDPNQIIDGYKLDGSPGSLDPADFAPDPPAHSVSLAFSAPLAVGAMTDAAHQAWLDALWNWVAVQHGEVFPDDDYYGNTLKMLAMIILSGNWWAPE
jgi:endo-1,4-beta-D-glucanase Y